MGLPRVSKRTGFTGVRQDGKVAIKIIEPGQGSTGYYTEEVLADAAQRGLFDDVPIMWDHVHQDGIQPEHPSIKNLVGWINPGARYQRSGTNGPGVYGTARIRGPQREDVYSLVQSPSGLSIHADGDLEVPGDVTSKVKWITRVKSVDLVIKPGAGGAVTEVLESMKELGEDAMGLYYRGQVLLESDEGPVATKVYEDDDGNYLTEDELAERFGSGWVARGAKNIASRGDRLATRNYDAQTRMGRAKERLGTTLAKGGEHVARNAGRYTAGAYGAGGLAAAGGGAKALMGRRKESVIDEETGDIWNYQGNLDEGFDEDDLEEMRIPFRPRKGLRGIPDRLKDMRMKRDLKRKGKSVMNSRAVRYGGTAAGGAAAGGAAVAGGRALRNRSRNEEEDESMPWSIINEETGDIWSYGGNLAEMDEADMDEDDLEEVLGSGLITRGATKVLGQGSRLMGNNLDDVSRFGRAKVAAGRALRSGGQHVAQHSDKYAAGALGAGGMAAAGAAGLGAKKAFGRKEEESFLDEETGNVWVNHGPQIQEEYDERDAIIEELSQRLENLENGGERAEKLAEAANLAMTYGSENSREVLMEAALNVTRDPRKAAYLGQAFSEAIHQDRVAHNSHWSNWSVPNNPSQDWRGMVEAPVGLAAAHGSGGGNAMLQEDANGRPRPMTEQDQIDALREELTPAWMR